MAAGQRIAGGSYVLIEALRINQDDHKVAKMKDVCCMGKNVISWLGDETDDGHRACQQRRTLATARDATTAQQLGVRWEETPAQFHDGCLLEMHELIRHPYWCKLWIVQELVTGNRQSLFVLEMNRWTGKLSSVASNRLLPSDPQ